LRAEKTVGTGIVAAADVAREIVMPRGGKQKKGAESFEASVGKAVDFTRMMHRPVAPAVAATADGGDATYDQPPARVVGKVKVEPNDFWPPTVDVVGSTPSASVARSARDEGRGASRRSSRFTFSNMGSPNCDAHCTSARSPPKTAADVRYPGSGASNAGGCTLFAHV